MFLVGSPSRTTFSPWQALNIQKRDPIAVRHGYVKATVRLRFVMGLCRMQDTSGLHFIREHALMATSWHEDCATDIMHIEGVSMARKGEPMKKHTAITSNSGGVLEIPALGADGNYFRPRGGRHEVASGMNARTAAIYHFEMCRAILVG